VRSLTLRINYSTKVLKLDDLAFTPCLLPWPEDGPEI
jgi:hypothetical protein